MLHPFTHLAQFDIPAGVRDVEVVHEEAGVARVYLSDTVRVQVDDEHLLFYQGNASRWVDVAVRAPWLPSADEDGWFDFYGFALSGIVRDGDVAVADAAQMLLERGICVERDMGRRADELWVWAPEAFDVAGLVQLALGPGGCGPIGSVIVGHCVEAHWGDGFLPAVEECVVMLAALECDGGQ